MYKTKSAKIKAFKQIPDLKDYISFHLFKKGQVIFYKDHLPYGLFILSSGEVEIYKNSKNPEIISGKALLGYDSFCNKKQYSVTAKALTDCKVFFLSNSDYQFLYDKDNSLLSWINVF